MLCNKLGRNEGMRCSGIKQNRCRVRVCEEHTQYHILELLGFLDSHMVDLTIAEVLLPLQTLLLVNSLGLLLIGTILSHMTRQSALEAYTKSLISLRGGIRLGLGYRK
jgi:hypothetical protein